MRLRISFIILDRGLILSYKNIFSIFMLQGMARKNTFFFYILLRIPPVSMLSQIY